MASAQRRLCAILHADLAGFVRLVENEEGATFEHLSSVRAEVCRTAIEGAGGTLLNSTADYVLAEFMSAQAAVGAAIDIQERMARFNANLVDKQRLLFRIGVHVGEILIDEENHDIFGDGVNLAERIQQMAEPGGIAVSRAVRDVADLEGDYTFVDGGERRAKRVSRPVHIFSIRARDREPTLSGSAQPARGTLHFKGADISGRSYDFDLEADDLKQRQQSVVIGRKSGQCDVVLSHLTVSRRHARLTVAQDNTLQIEDLESTNGTSIDGTPIEPGVAHPLRPGAHLKIGDIELVIHFD